MEECRINNYKSKRRILYVDADSCPVKHEIIETSKKFTIEVIFVASHAHSTDEFPEYRWKYVDCNKEEVDLYIMNHVKAGDIVVTQDIGLASTLLLKGVHVLSERGVKFDERFISSALHMRYLAAKERRQGVYRKGPKRLTSEDKARFTLQLIKILSKLEGV